MHPLRHPQAVRDHPRRRTHIRAQVREKDPNLKGSITLYLSFSYLLTVCAQFVLSYYTFNIYFS